MTSVKIHCSSLMRWTEVASHDMISLLQRMPTTNNKFGTNAIDKKFSFDKTLISNPNGKNEYD